MQKGWENVRWIKKVDYEHDNDKVYRQRSTREASVFVVFRIRKKEKKNAKKFQSETIREVTERRGFKAGKSLVGGREHSSRQSNDIGKKEVEKKKKKAAATVRGHCAVACAHSSLSSFSSV